MTQESRLVIVIDSKNAERNTRAVADELANLTTKGGQAESQMTAMSSSIKSLVGYMGGILTINKAIAMADGYTQMAARIRNATQSAEEYALVQDRLLNTANTTYRALGEAQEVYLSMAGGMKSLGKSTKDTLDLTDSLSFSFTHNATRVDQAQSAMDALSKSMAKGKVDGDAWISIVTGADNVIADMAKQTGKTEAEIRKLGAEGKASLNDLIKTLIATRDENEKLANNMENSLADGFTKLSNEVTVYLGKANEATSATGIMAGGLGILADNLDMVANTGAALGIGYITSALLTKGAAVKASIVLSTQQQIADRAELVSQTQLTAAEVRRTASLAQFTTMQLADAKATAARMTGMQRLAYVQSTVIPLEVKATQATAAHTAATTADTVAQEINNKARSRGAMLLGLIGGPIGAITLGVTALAAGYMYMSSRTAEANAKLEEQGKIALETDESLKQLAGNDKISAVKNLTAAFNDQNDKLAKSKEAVDAVLFAIRATSVENEKARKITEDARNGVISYNEAIKLLNKEKVPTELYDQLKKTAIQYDENSLKASNSQRVLKILGVEFKLSGNAAQNAVVQIEKNTAELGKNETAAQKAAQAQTDYQKSLADRKYYAEYKKILIDTYGFSQEKAEEYAKAREKAGGIGAKLTEETKKGINETIASESVLIKLIEDQNKAEKEKTNQKNKQLKITQAELEVAKRSAALVESSGLGKYAESKGIPSSVIAGLLAQESKGIRNAKSHTGAIGYFQTTSGYRKQNNMSVADSYDLEKSGKIAIDNIAKVYEKTGDLAQAILSHNAGESGAKQFTKTGKVTGSAERNKEVSQYVGKVSRYADIIAGGVGKSGISEKDNDRAYSEQIKARLELVKQGLNLQEQYESEQAKRTKARNEEINLAQQTGQTALIPKIKERYDAQDKLAKLQQEFDVEGHKWTEERKLQYTYETNVLRLTAEGKFSEDQKKIFEKGYTDQYDQELGYIKLAKETQLFQAKQAYMHEVDLMQERYRLEMQEIDKIGDAKQRAAMREVTAARLIDDYEKKRKAAEDNLNQTSAQIGGFSEYYAIQKEMEDRAAVMDEARKYELISEEEHKAALIEIEKKYMDAKRSLNLSYGEQIAGSVSAMFKQQGDEQNKYYKAAITIEKSFAIARSMIAIQAGIAQAANNPWPLNLAAMASVAAQTASIVSNIKTIHVEGFATGGLFTGDGHVRGPGTSTSDSINATLSDYEFVTKASSVKKIGVENMEYMNRTGKLPIQHADGGLVTPRDTYRAGIGTVDAINSGKSLGEKAAVVQPVINIHTLPGETADVSVNSDGSLDVRIRKIAEEHIVGQLNNPNSQASKTMKQNFNVAQRR